MKRRLLIALLVLVFIPGVVVAEEPAPETSLWSTLVSWFDELVETFTTPEAETESDDEEEEPLPSTWGTIDPIG